MDRILLQQLYNIAVTRNPILFLYIIKKLNDERPFLKEIQEKGYFNFKETEEMKIPDMVSFFNQYPEEEKYEIAEEFIKKLVLLSISYKIEKGKYSIENQLNINFEKGGASLKQIHKSIGIGYTKSYVQKIVIGKLKHPRSPQDGKIYPIIEAESIPKQKIKLFTLNEKVYEAIKNEEKNLKGVILELFFYELELKQYIEEILSKRKKLSQIQVQLADLDKVIKILKQEHNRLNKSNEKYKNNTDIQNNFESLVKTMEMIKTFRSKVSKVITSHSKFKIQIENFLKKLNRLSFAELTVFYSNFTESLLYFENKKISLFQKLDKLIHDSEMIINEMSMDKISQMNYDYQTKNHQYNTLKREITN